PDKCQLSFEKDPSNEYDLFAVKIKTTEGALLGFVPAFYSEFVTKVLDYDCLTQLRIERIDPSALPQLQVRLSLKGTLNKRSYEIEKNYVGVTQH
ncbi:HIRAN domain-containing protein, partial [Sporolactobacillus inulinus]|uniref:HIRAN domain-containing protein n=1 Tax=Sporolactobacillus inulinus TaxID=2078 RepID=UPI001C3F8B59